MADATWTVLPSLQTWNSLQQQFVVYQALSIVVFPLLIGALLILFRPAWPFVWSRLVTHEHMICLVDRLTRNITPDRRFRKSNGVIYFLRPDPKNMRRPSWFFPNRHKKYFPDPFIKVYPGKSTRRIILSILRLCGNSLHQRRSRNSLVMVPIFRNRMSMGNAMIFMRVRNRPKRLNVSSRSLYLGSS